MKLIGCAMTSPGTILEFLLSQKTKNYVLPIGVKLQDSENEMTLKAREEIKKVSTILILTYPDFRANLEVLNSKNFKGKTVVIFAPVVRYRNITNCALLDVVSTDIAINQSYRFKPAEFSLLLNPPADAVVEIKNEDYIAELIDNALAGSILTKLMTLIYQIPNSKTQNDYRDRIIGWFVKGDDKIATISKMIADLPDKKLLAQLIELIENSTNYKKVFQHIADLNAKGKPIAYSKISTKFEVSDFDLRYMISVASNLSFGEKLKEKPIEDHYYGHGRNTKKRATEGTKPNVRTKVKLKKR